MSITDFVNKIKGVKLSQNFSIIYAFIIILVALSSFGLGRFSRQNDPQNEPISASQAPDISSASNVLNSQEGALNQGEKRYLASRNGKLYYTAGCSASKRIAEKNIVWFSTSREAEQAGYQLSSSCK